MLLGQGDICIKVVDQDAWDWIMNPVPGAQVPASVLTAWKNDEEEPGEAETSSKAFGVNEPPGDYMNARANVAPPVQVCNSKLWVFTVGDLLKKMPTWCALLGIERFEDTLEGVSC